MEAEEGQLKHLEARNRELEREVERWRLRQELEQKARLSIHFTETMLIDVRNTGRIVGGYRPSYGIQGREGSV